jgi:hypothetical protein
MAGQKAKKVTSQTVLQLRGYKKLEELLWILENLQRVYSPIHGWHKSEF